MKGKGPPAAGAALAAVRRNKGPASIFLTGVPELPKAVGRGGRQDAAISGWLQEKKQRHGKEKERGKSMREFAELRGQMERRKGNRNKQFQRRNTTKNAPPFNALTAPCFSRAPKEDEGRDCSFAGIEVFTRAVEDNRAGGGLAVPEKRERPRQGRSKGVVTRYFAITYLLSDFCCFLKKNYSLIRGDFDLIF